MGRLRLTGVMEPPRWGRLAVAGLGAIVCGVGVSVLKGNGDGVRSAIGNLSAPWLLIPFAAVCAVGERRVGRAALIGAFTTLAALGGFYVANAFVLDLGPHPWPEDLRLTLVAGARYFELGLVSGPVFGGLGAWWQRSARSHRLTGPAAALLLLEPLASVAYSAGPGGDWSGRPVVWAGELVLGIVCLVFARAAPRPTA